VRKQFAGARYADRGAGYGIPGVTVDGTDVLEVYRACSRAVTLARDGGGPTLIESVTMRMHGHSASDDASYVPAGMIEEWKKRDPVARFEQTLLGDGILTQQMISDYEKSIHADLEAAVTAAEADGYPDGEDAGKGVFAS
jgi:TPP-dependent pyruvate/acetoin dehydrogenase alpha subunit